MSSFLIGISPEPLPTRPQLPRSQSAEAEFQEQIHDDDDGDGYDNDDDGGYDDDEDLRRRSSKRRSSRDPET